MNAVPAVKAEPPKYWPDEDARTIMRAHEILGNDKRKKDVIAELKKQVDAANSALAHAQAIKDVGTQIKSVFGGK